METIEVDFPGGKRIDAKVGDFSSRPINPRNSAVPPAPLPHSNCFLLP